MSSASLDVLIAQSKNLSKQGLRPFVEKQLKDTYGPSWLSKADCRKVAGEPNWELQALLKTIILNWPTVFQNVLPPSARGLAFELKDWRNHVAHEYDIDVDDAARLLDTSARLLKSVGAIESGELERMWLSLVQSQILHLDAVRASSRNGTPLSTDQHRRNSTLPVATDRLGVGVEDDGAPLWEPCVIRVGAHLGVTLNRKRGRCAFSTDLKYGVCCLVSKEYPGIRYWWTIHARQLESLQSASEPYVAFACGLPNSILLIPAAEVEPWLPDLNLKSSTTGDGWHIHIVHDGNDWYILLKGRGQRVPITKYLVR